MRAGILNVFLRVVAQSLLSSVDVKDEVCEGGERGNVLVLEKYHVFAEFSNEDASKRKHR